MPQRRVLDRLSVGLEPHRRDNIYRALVAREHIAAVRDLPFVDLVSEPTAGDRITSDFLRQLAKAKRSQSQVRSQTFDATAQAPSDVQAILSVLAATPDAQVVESAGATVRFRARITADFIPALAALPELKLLNPVRAARLQLDCARVLIGVELLQASGSEWTGDGETVAVIDSGIDTEHPDLAHQIASQLSLVDGSDVRDRFGHGTHVSGIIAGTGEASSGLIRGIAPGAKLAILKVTDGVQVDLPLNMATWLQPVVDAGARIVNLSLGLSPEESGSTYDACCESIDAYLFEHPEVVLVVSAGNSGRAPNGASLLRTVSSPGSAKNVVTVGASSNSRQQPQETWGQRTPSMFRNPPASQLLVTGAPNVLAAISGRGPASLYGLVKPDVVAPGTYILSARASGVSPRLPWGACADHDNRYMYCGGSSMAAPFVAGAAAIVRQYLRSAMGIGAPTAALVKAVLIAATMPIDSGRVERISRRSRVSGLRPRVRPNSSVERYPNSGGANAAP